MNVLFVLLIGLRWLVRLRDCVMVGADIVLIIVLWLCVALMLMVVLMIEYIGMLLSASRGFGGRLRMYGREYCGDLVLSIVLAEGSLCLRLFLMLVFMFTVCIYAELMDALIGVRFVELLRMSVTAEFSDFGFSLMMMRCWLSRRLRWPLELRVLFEFARIFLFLTGIVW